MSEGPESQGDSKAERRNAGPGATEEVDVTVEQLYSELRSTGADSGYEEVRLAPEQRSEVILNDVLKTLLGGPEFRFDESIVKENLDVILLLLVANRSSGTHGKGLMGDLATIFDAHLSPGTVYPQLHDLEEGGAIERPRVGPDEGVLCRRRGGTRRAGHGRDGTASRAGAVPPGCARRSGLKLTEYRPKRRVTSSRPPR